jgi:predicted kinase
MSSAPVDHSFSVEGDLCSLSGHDQNGNMMIEVIILSGIPGSGKTTWIEHNLDLSRVRIFSADHYFTDSSGVYLFDPDRIQQAHSDCLRRFVSALLEIERDEYPSEQILVVDNTNTTAWEIAPYYSLAAAWGHPVRIVRTECDPALAHSRNVHGVSMEHVGKMFERMKGAPFPSYWRIDTFRCGSDDRRECAEVEPCSSEPFE